MAFQDLPEENPFLRLFTEGPYSNLMFAAHGIWIPKRGMTRVKYTYYWYTQPTETLKTFHYEKTLQGMGAIAPIDTFGPGSGKVANMILLPLEQGLFGFTAKTFVQIARGGNTKEWALLIFHVNNLVPAMSLEMLDTQLLPQLKYPLTNPVHMVVCRSLEMHHVTPVVTNDVRVMLESEPIKTPFDSIMNDML